MVDNSEDSNGQRREQNCNKVPGDKEKELKRIATTELSEKR